MSVLRNIQYIQKGVRFQTVIYTAQQMCLDERMCILNIKKLHTSVSGCSYFTKAPSQLFVNTQRNRNIYFKIDNQISRSSLNATTKRYASNKDKSQLPKASAAQGISSTYAPDSNVSKSNELKKSIKEALSPYCRLMRLDRPIGV